MIFLFFHLPYLHYFSLKFISFSQSFVTDTGPVIINGSHGVTEELRYFSAVRDSQSDKGKDAEFGVQQFSRFGLHRFGKQGIELVYEVGKELQEGHVKVGIELFQFLVEELGRFYGFIKLFHSAGSGNLIQGAAV